MLNSVIFIAVTFQSKAGFVVKVTSSFLSRLLRIDLMKSVSM